MRGAAVQGSKIVALRLKQGFTQGDLATATGLDVKTVRKAEQGKRLDLKTISRLAEALKTLPASLLVMQDGNSPLQRQWREIVTQWIFWFDDQDIENILTLYADDAVLHLPGGSSIPFGGKFRGKEQIRQANEAAWSTSRHQPARLEDISIFVSDAGVAMQGDREVVVPSGKLVKVPCLQVFSFKDLLIVEHHVEFDTLEFAQLLQETP